MTFEIQHLHPADAHRVRELNALFAEAFEDRAAYQSAPPGEAYLHRVLAQDHVIVLVATAHERMVGALVAYELPKLEQARSEVYLYDLAVAAAHRRRGVATGLIDRLRDIASQRGAWVVFVQADPGDGPATALYQKLGEREEVLHFDLPVR